MEDEEESIEVWTSSPLSTASSRSYIAGISTEEEATDGEYASR